MVTPEIYTHYAAESYARAHLNGDRERRRAFAAVLIFCAGNEAYSRTGSDTDWPGVMPEYLTPTLSDMAEEDRERVLDSLLLRDMTPREAGYFTRVVAAHLAAPGAMSAEDVIEGLAEGHITVYGLSVAMSRLTSSSRSSY